MVSLHEEAQKECEHACLSVFLCVFFVCLSLTHTIHTVHGNGGEVEGLVYA